MKVRYTMDFYQTHAALTRVLLQEINPSIGIRDTVLEPCAGAGAISSILKDCGPFIKVITNDLDPCQPTDMHWDATLECSWDQAGGGLGWDWVITNPPFNQAPKILPLALPRARVGMAMLLRLSYLEPCADVKKPSYRAQWLQENPPTQVVIVSPRPKFRVDTKGSDSVTVAWMVWHKAQVSQPRQPFVFRSDWQQC